MPIISNKLNTGNHAEIIKNILAGDNHSATVLYYLLLPFVTAIVKERVFNIEVDELKIMSHDIVTIIFEKLPKYDLTRNTIFPWAGRITKNIIIDQHRRKKASISLNKLTEKNHNLFSIISANKLTPELLLINKENAVQINNLLMDFPEEKRRLLIDYSEGKSMAELSHIYGKSLSAITSEVFRIKKRFSSRLEVENPRI